MDHVRYMNSGASKSKELLRNAAKQRIRRMVAPKKKRNDLSVPGWVAERWNSGTREKDEMAALLQDVNWCKACRIKVCTFNPNASLLDGFVKIPMPQSWPGEVHLRADPCGQEIQVYRDYPG